MELEEGELPPGHLDDGDDQPGGWDGRQSPPADQWIAVGKQGKQPRADNEGSGKKRKRSAVNPLAGLCKLFLRGACTRGGKCELSHETQPCRHWAAGACVRGADCHFIHVGGPGSAAAAACLTQQDGDADGGSAAVAEVATQFRRFTPSQAARFRRLVGSPDAAQHLEELRRLVGPLVPLTFGLPPGAAAEGVEAAAVVVKDTHARNCGCSECSAARVAAGEGNEGQGGGRAQGDVAAVLANAATVTAPQSKAMWRALLGSLRR
jgi:Zinc finger C-x8-C-x5-C-x3-H type (and similar)